MKLWGPGRLLTTLLNEMKNARFKAGAKRGNFHNVAKDVAMFWVEQSDYELQTMPELAVCQSDKSPVLVTGVAADFHDSVIVSQLLEHACVDREMEISFLASVEFHGVRIRRGEHVLLDVCVYAVSRIARVAGKHYMHLHEIAPRLCVDALGAYYVEACEVGDHLTQSGSCC